MSAIAPTPRAALAGRRELDVGTAALFGAFASAIVGLYALATAGPVGPMPIAVLLLAVVAGAWRMRRGVVVVDAGEAGTLRTGLATFVLALVVIPAHWLVTGSWVLAAIDLLVILQANRLLALAQGRALGQVLLVALLMLLGAAVLTLNISFLGAVFLFCLTGTWTAVFLAIFDPRAKGADRVVPWRFAGVVLAAGAAIFLLTCGFFAVLPRLSFQAFQGGILKAEGVSGFSEEVRLGDIGSVKQDRSPVMRVELSGAVPLSERLYWRGIALDRYQEARWFVSDPSEQRLSPRRSGDGQLFEVRGPSRGPKVRQAITLEPIDVSVLFGLPGVESVEGDIPLLARNSTDSLVFRAKSYGRTRYTVTSSPPREDPKELDGLRAVAPGPNPGRYLEIPDDVKAAILPLAQSLAGEGSDWRKARRIEAAMQTWEYSLVAPPQTRPDPVESFLLDAKRGWCEQYSSGMILLLRAIGIPARMANGFHGGELNEYGGYLLVRRSDAHSWVEVPFDGVGWVTFDPTPGGGRTPPDPLQKLRHAWDYLKQLWAQRVVTYDIFDQFALVSAAGDRAHNFSEQLQRRIRALDLAREGKQTAAALAGIALVAAIAVRLRRRRGRGAGRPEAVEAAERWWGRVERSLAKAGYSRARGETPWELARRAGHEDWAEVYYAARFSTRPLDADRRAAMDRIAKLL